MKPKFNLFLVASLPPATKNSHVGSSAATALATAALALLPALHASATVIYKKGTMGNLNLVGSWGTTEAAATSPASIGISDTLWFGGSGQAGAITAGALGGNLTVGALRLDNITGTPNYNVTISAGSTLTLNGNNDYNAGYLSGIVLNSGAGGTLTINSNIALGASQRWVASRNLTVGGNVDLGANTLTLNSAGGTTTISGIISGTGGVTRDFSAGGGVILSGANTYTGATNVNLGTLSLTGSGSIANTSAINVNNGTLSTYSVNALGASASTINLGSTTTQGILTYTGTGETTDRVINFAGTTGGATLNNNGTGLLRFTANTTTSGAGAKGITFGGSGNGQLDGTISSNGGLLNITKSGAGTWTLGGNIVGGANPTGAMTVSAGVLNLGGTNTYTGATSVNNAGTRLNLTGSLTSAITVANGATITGTGSTTGLLALSAGSSVLLSGSGAVTANGVTAAVGVNLVDPTLNTVGAHSFTVVTYGAGAAPTLANFTINGGGAATIRGAGLVNTGTATTLNYTTVANVWNTTSGTWDVGTNANWTNGSDSLYYNGDSATFNEPASASTVTLNSSVAPSSVAFTNSTNAYTVAGTGAITGAGSLTKSGAGLLTLSTVNSFTGAVNISAGTVSVATVAAGGTNSGLGAGTAINLGDASNNGTLQYTGATASTNRTVALGAGGGTIEVTTGANTLTTTGLISGTGGLTKTGAGTLAVNNNTNSFTGNVVVNSGTVSTGASAGSATTGYLGANNATGRTVTINSGATLSIGSSNLFNGGSQALVNIPTLSVTGGTVTANSNYEILGNVTLNSGALLTVFNQNAGTYRGFEFKGGSTVTVGGSSASSMTTTGTGAFHLGGSGGAVTFAVADATTTSATDLIISAPLINGSGDNSGVGALTKTGAGTLLLSGANTYTGATTINAGTLALSGGAAIADTGTVILADASGATLRLDGSETIGSLSGGGVTGGAVDLQANTLTVAETGAQTFTGVISGTGGVLTKTGVGTLTLSGANSYTGGTSLNGGVLNVGSSDALGTTGTVAFGGGTLQHSAANTADYSTRFSTAASQAYKVDTNGQTVAWASDLTSSGGTLTKLGTGTLTLSGANSYTGTTTVNNGTLNISGTTNTTAGTVTVGNGGTLTVANGGTLTTTGTLQLGAGTTTNAFNVNSGGIVNAGILNNSWGTDVTVNGTLNVTTSYTVGTNAAKFIAVSGTINAASFSLGNAATTVNFTNTGVMNLTGVMTFVAGNSPTFNQSAGTVNTAGLALDGATSTYTLTGGRINIGSSGIAGTGATRNINLGAATVGARANWSSALAMSLTNAATGTTFNTLDSVDDTTARKITLSGALSGGGQLVKSGVGTLTLTGTNTYTGVTNINEGTLELGSGGSIADSSRIHLAAGTNLVATAAGLIIGGTTAQILSGTGTVQSDLTIGANGIHAVGDSPGVQEVDGSLTYAGESIFSWDLATLTTEARGTAFDGVDVTGNMTVASDAIFQVVLGTAGSENNAFWSEDQTWTGVFAVTGTIGNAFTNFQVVNSLFAPATIANQPNGHFTFDNSNGSLSWSAVPEPSSALAGLLLGAGLLRRKRSA